MHKHDRWALLCFLVVPFLVFGIPTLLGHPPISGDNLIQNYPLRVLSGRDIASGHLPLFNPYANSGTPLLGGMNSGSLYPLTLIFAFLPGLLAWVINMAAVYVTAAIGMYALLRWQSLRPLASFVGAVTFAYAGSMIGQMVHLGVIQGFALIPWMILAEMCLCRAMLGIRKYNPWRMQLRAMLPSVTGMAVLWGLIFLTGEPRADAQFELLVIVVVPVEILLHTGVLRATWRGRLFVILGNAVGVAWGAAIAMIQLLPGYAFIAVSQRSSITYQFYGSGSLTPKWSVLLFVQDIFGGNGQLHQPSYFVNYNLPEVTGYAGIVALVAIAAFLLQFTWHGWTGEQRRFTLYIVLIIVGLAATYGSFTPLGHLFHDLPFYGKTRLQSRNVVMVDVAAAALLAWWINAIGERRSREASLVGWRRFFSVTPAAVVVVVCGFMLFDYRGMLSWLVGSGSDSAGLGGSERPTIIFHLALALALIVSIVFYRNRHSFQKWVLAFIALDIAVFLLFCTTGLSSGNVNVEPSSTTAASSLGTQGRFAFIDPNDSQFNQFSDLGLPNLNVFTKLSSIQGYGSLEGSHYSTITGTHPRAALDPCQLAEGTFNQLRLATVAIDGSALAQPLGNSVVANEVCSSLHPKKTMIRYFGTSLLVQTVSISPYFVGLSATSPTVRVSLRFINAAGVVFGPTFSSTNAHLDTFVVNGVQASGFKVIASKEFSSPLATVVIKATPIFASADYTLNSLYQDAFGTTAWRLGTQIGGIAVFYSTRVRPPVWLVKTDVGAKILSTHSAFYGDTWFQAMGTRSFTVDRSMAWLPGWRVTAVNTVTHKEISVTDERTGLIQQVTLPPGTWEVHFHYHAPYITIGVAVSGASVVLFVIAAWFVRPRERRSLNGRVRQ